MAVARFCSECGAALLSAPPVTCTTCGTSHWSNPKPCANAVIVDNGKILLVRRAQRESPWYWMWCAPGGFCEMGEHPIETAEREVLEETGFRVTTTGYIGVWVDRYADDPASSHAEVINVAYYLATVDAGEPGPVDANEVSDVRWFRWEELPADLAPPGTLDAVLTVARRAHDDGPTPSPLSDRPT